MPPIQVLHTLSKLSWTPRATAKCSVGFPAARNRPSQDEEQIYHRVEVLVTEDQYTDFYDKHLGGTDKEKDIYEENKLIQV